MDTLEIMKKRHSVRQYMNRAVELSRREEINSLIKDVNVESKLSIQAFYDEPKCFDSFMAHYGKFENVKNLILRLLLKCVKNWQNLRKNIENDDN